MISIQTEDFDLAREYAELRRLAPGAGAIATFSGLVRELDDAHAEKHGAVESLILEHYPGMTEKALARIVNDAEQQWELLAVRVIHRVGKLHPGAQIVFVGVASSHREAAFAAAEFIMDFLKSQAPFWKKQETSLGSHWVESREADQQALQRWRDRLG